jgi:hypothetical protein
MVEKKGSGASQNTIIMFSGYDDDPRAIFEIEEIRKWVSRFYTTKPHLFYYLAATDAKYIRSILLCIAEIKPNVLMQRSHQTVPMIIDIALVEQITSDAVAYSKTVKDPIEAQFKLANSVLAAFD